MSWEIRQGDALEALREMPAESVQCCVTSPPYWNLRDYDVDGQIGLEGTPGEYVETLTEVFAEVYRVLAADGTLWLNLGDSYAASGRGGGGGSFQDNDVGRKVSSKNNRREAVEGFKRKDLIGIPWRVAFALQEFGWYLRSDIVWHKPNPMPESVKDRPTSCHEFIFLLTKSEKYYYDYEAISEPAKYGTPNSPESIKSLYGQGFTRRGMSENEKRIARARSEHKRNPDDKVSGIRPRKEDKQRGHSRRHDGFNDRWDDMKKKGQCFGRRNKRDVWKVATRPFTDAHFAVFPPDLIHPCILAGSREGDLVLDPFAGAGTTGLVAQRLGREFVGIELNPEYCAMARERIAGDMPLFNSATDDETKA